MKAFLKYAFLVMLGLGLLDTIVKRWLDPLMGVRADAIMPLWLAVLLMSTGGVGFLFVRPKKE